MNNEVEFSASERYFIETGLEFSKLPPTEQKKLMEVEIDRKSEGDISFTAGIYGRRGDFDIS